ncbi:MAG: FAD-binding protein [Gemmatimonadaceae bacterium]|nr:FAD-binding protein [Gemmatimonadaceae bacterium]
MTAAAAASHPVRDMVMDAAGSGTPLRIAGRSHWMDAGRPVAASRIASLAAHSGVVDYVPGDLTITVRSGTTLREIEQITGAEGQWLPLDPHGSADGTIGATIATGSFGPLAHGFGRARDLMLGVEFVTGDGKIVRGGGRVVKNVAGFDLVRLATGSWGTLGVISEATLRLYSLPARPATLSLSVPDGANALAQRITSILSTPATPFAVEMVDAELAGRIGLPRRPQILIELGGNHAAVEAQRHALSQLGGAHDVGPEVWKQFRDIEDVPPSANGSRPPVVLRISALPTRIAELWMSTHNAIGHMDGAMMHASAGLGIVRCILPAGTPLETIQPLTSAAAGATIVFERLPSHMWPTLSPSVIADRLSQGMSRSFDPHNILNAGIMGPVH